MTSEEINERQRYRQERINDRQQFFEWMFVRAFGIIGEDDVFDVYVHGKHHTFLTGGGVFVCAANAN